MGIRGIPASHAEFEHVDLDTERVRFIFAESNARVGAVT